MVMTKAYLIEVVNNDFLFKVYLILTSSALSIVSEANTLQNHS